MRKNRLIALIGTLTMAAAGLAAVSVGVSSKKAEGVSATDYSNTIRVYVDLNWSGIDKVEGQVGPNDTWGAYSSSTGLDTGSTYGKYYKDGTSSSNLSTVNLYFQQTQHWHPYDPDDDWNTDNSKIHSTFKPGYMYQITDIAWKQEGWGGDHKFFTYVVNEIGKLPEEQTTYTINFAAGTGGSGSMTSVTPNASEAYTLPSRSGKIYKDKAHFDHWVDGDGNEYADAATIPANTYDVGDEITLTAVYREYDIVDGYYIEFFNKEQTASDRRIKLDYNGKTGTDSQHVKTGVSLAAGDTFKIVYYEDEAIPAGRYYGTEQSNPGSEFLNAPNKGQLYADGDSNFVVRVAGTYDFYFNDQYESYKVWIPANSYTVVYDNNGGSGTVGDQTAYFYDNSTDTGKGFAADVYGKSTFTAPDSTKIFDGWSTNMYATQGEFKPGDMQETADKVPNPTSGNSVTLYAIWRDKTVQDGYYATGTFSGGLASMTRDDAGSQYYVDVTLAVGQNFKLVNYVNESPSYFGADLDKTGSESNPTAVFKGQLSIDSVNNYVAVVAGTYRVYLADTVDGEGNRIWVSPTTVQASVTFAVNNSDYGSLSGYDEPFNVNTGTSITQNGTSITIGDKTITAVPATDTAQFDYEFTGWTIDPEGTTVEEDTVITANFTQSTQKYTITWKNYNGTTLETDTNVAYGTTPSYDGSTPVKPSSAEHTYTFSGWSPAVSSVTGNAEYTAQFSEEIRYHEVTLTVNDSTMGSISGYTEPIQVAGGTSVTVNGSDLIIGGNTYTAVAAADSTDGHYSYSFKNWSVETGAVITGEAIITATFEATVKKYTVTWKNGDTVLKTLEKVIWGSNPEYDGDTPTKESSVTTDYEFSGWSPAQGAITGNTVYQAQFSESTRKYTVTFENDGNGKVYCEDLETEASSITVPYGTAISTDGAKLTVGTNEYLAIENNIPGSTVTFNDWTISPSGSTVAGNVTITANFTVVDNEYMLAYEFNGGTPTSEDYSHEGFDYHYGDEIKLPTLTKDGYTFVGFCEDEGLEGDCYVDTYTLTDDVELYAKFTLDSYNITFSNNGGQGGSIDKTSYSISELDQVVNITAPTKEGNGPSYTITKGDDYVGDDPVVQNSSVIIPHGAYGSFSINTVWTPDTYTVTYAPGAYGEEEQSTATKIYNVDLTLAGAIFTRTGYTQVGWATTDGGAKVYDLSTTYSANAGVTLYPVWEIDTYTVSYNKGQYGAGEIASQTKTYGEALTLSSSTFTREGYRQDGWSTSDGDAKVYELGASYTNNEAVTLYPHWVKQCVVTFASSNSEYGSVSSSGPITVDEGTSVTVSGNSITIGTTTVTATPTTSTDDVEYSFTGWSVSTGSTISSNTEIFANFESELTALGEAKQFAQEFVKTINETDGLCKISGYDDKGNPIYDVNMTQLQTFWENHSDAFKSLSGDAQGYLKDASPDQSEEASALGKFAWSYQYVYTKYGKNFADYGGDFLEKGYTPNSSRLVSVSDVSTSTWIIAAVAVVGIAAVGVFFIYKKRKEI